jgi:hypothetical protein
MNRDCYYDVFNRLRLLPLLPCAPTVNPSVWWRHVTRLAPTQICSCEQRAPALLRVHSSGVSSGTLIPFANLRTWFRGSVAPCRTFPHKMPVQMFFGVQQPCLNLDCDVMCFRREWEQKSHQSISRRRRWSCPMLTEIDFCVRVSGDVNSSTSSRHSSH